MKSRSNLKSKAKFRFLDEDGLRSMYLVGYGREREYVEDADLEELVLALATIENSIADVKTLSKKDDRDYVGFLWELRVAILERLMKQFGISPAMFNRRLRAAAAMGSRRK